MSDYIDVIAIVEGKTEQVFIELILAPYLAIKKIYIRATQVSKPGQKGGDVRFVRAKRDIGLHLKQRTDTYVTTFIDYYGTKEWPGLDTVQANTTPEQISQHINTKTKNAVNALFEEYQSERRFIPYIAMHEFEALLFSDSEILAKDLVCDEATIKEVIKLCGEPESINNNPSTAPSKRLDGWSLSGKFPKTTQGIAIAREIGIEKMRQQCPQFNHWIASFEVIVEAQNEA
jgi:hypothetical protein